MPYDNHKFTIRDEGVLNVIGSNLCQQISDRAFDDEYEPRPRCAVGVSGTDAIIEIEGERAIEICEEIIQWGNYNDKSFYETVEQPDKKIICTLRNEETDVFVIRDRGLIYQVGNDLCDDFGSIFD